MSILNDIQKDLLDPNVKISSILLKARVFAYEIDNKDLKTWVANEIDGYNSIDELPKYRLVKTQSYGNFSGPFGSYLRNANIPQSCLPSDAEGYSTNFNFVHSVSGLESIIEQRDSDLQFPWPADNVIAISSDIYKGYVCMQAWWHISLHQIRQLLENIRNRLLTFILELDNLNFDIFSQTRENKQNEEMNRKVSTIFTNIVMGDNNQLEIGPDNQQTMIVVPQGDIKTLKKLLENLQLPQNEIDLLIAAIEEDGNITKKNEFGPKVKEWLGKALVEISKGAWKISLEVLTTTLTKYLNSFYGAN